MKTLIAFLAFIFFTEFASSQSYKKIVNRGNKWNYLSQLYFTCEEFRSKRKIDTFSPDCEGGESKTYSLYLSNDTIIDTINYTKVLADIIRYNGTVTLYSGAIREDTTEQKVYIKLPDQKEQLLYSFNLEPGDTISIDTSNSKDAVTIRYVISDGDYTLDELTGKKVTIIDSLIRLNGMPSYSTFTDDWYEGLGSLKMLFDLHHIDVMEGELQLLCFSQNENVRYSNPEWNVCEYTAHVGTTNLESELLLNIYPNPVNNQLFIETKLEIDKIEIADLTGKSIINTHLFNIDFSDINNGFYIINVYLKSGRLISKKIIKYSH